MLKALLDVVGPLILPDKMWKREGAWTNHSPTPQMTGVSILDIVWELWDKELDGSWMRGKVLDEGAPIL